MNWILKRLRRITLTTTYLPEIDGLRFIAILAVILCHIAADLVLRHGLKVEPNQTWLFFTMENGERGVQLFFTISGFILAIPFARRFLADKSRPDLKKYFRRRLFRLEPPYLLNVIILTIATWAVTPSLRPTLIWHFLTAITYTHLLVFHYVNPINMIWWSLEVETQFYILMPLLALAFKIRPAWLRRGIVVTAALSAFAWQNASGSWAMHWTILGQIQFFLAGILAADLYQSGALRRKLTVVWDVLGALAVLTVFALPDWWRIPGPVLTFCIIVGALNGKVFRSFLSLPWISAIGGMCYTIYLWHVFVMALLLKLTIKLVVVNSFLLSTAIQCSIMLPVIFFFSVVLFLTVEKPCMEPEWPTALRNYLANLFKRDGLPARLPEAE